MEPYAIKGKRGPAVNTKQLQYVLTLAREGSFSRAADALGISQPSLSQYVKKIEQELDVLLFERGAGTVRLTDAGHAYVAAGQRILEIERDMERTLLDVAAHKSGTLTVGVAPYRSAALMPQLAARFKQSHPGICLVADERGSNQLIEALERGEIDLALAPLPVSEKLFATETVMEEELVLAVPDALASRFAPVLTTGRRYPAVDIKQADGLPFCMITQNQIMQKNLEDLCRAHGLTLPCAVVVRSLEAQIAMVGAGLGAALVPTGIERFGTAGVTYYSIKQPLPRRQIAAIYRKDKPLSHLARAFIEMMKETIGGQ